MQLTCLGELDVSFNYLPASPDILFQSTPNLVRLVVTGNRKKESQLSALESTTQSNGNHKIVPHMQGIETKNSPQRDDEISIGKADQDNSLQGRISRCTNDLAAGNLRTALVEADAAVQQAEV